MIKPRALRSGDRIALIAPASPFKRDDFDRGVVELRRLGFDPVFEESVFARHAYTAGDATLRAAAFMRAWRAPDVAAIIAVRGGYGSAQLLPLLGGADVTSNAKPFIAYSDNTSLLDWIRHTCGVVAFHGPMIDGRFAEGERSYDRDSFERVLMHATPAGALRADTLEVLAPGDAAGILVGGTLTQLTASLGTPFAFDPPRGHVLFLDEVGERPYRIDRMLTQMRQGGLLARAAGIVFNELPRCDEPAQGGPSAKAVVADVLRDFPGPVLFGLPSGHTTGRCMTLPLGVRARIVTGTSPALVIEESAVV